MVQISRKVFHDACTCALKKVEADYDFKAEGRGEKGTLEYRVFFKNHEKVTVSPWHSIPLYTDHGYLHFVCEIPRYTRAKFEVCTSELGNPIKQDSKKGKPRFYGIDMKWNYGMFPQTWEDPAHASEDCGGFVGDSDPVDVVDIGNHDGETGGVYAVKPVAALAMIDEGELDWKVVAISTKDPRHELVNEVSDVETHFPGVLSEIREWFRTYKTYEGKPLNKFELNEMFVGRDYTLDVIGQTHNFWKTLVLKARSSDGVDKMAVGEVPVITGCFEPDESTPTTEILATTIKTVLEAVHNHEEQLHHSEDERFQAVEGDMEATPVAVKVLS